MTNTATINRRAVEILFAEDYFDRDRHKWLGFNSGEHYGVESATGRVVFGPRTSQGVIDWIDAHGRPDAFNYSNASRYQLAKSGLYPRTKAGNAALAADVETAARVGYAAAARVALCDEKTIRADYRHHAAQTDRGRAVAQLQAGAADPANDGRDWEYIPSQSDYPRTVHLSAPDGTTAALDVRCGAQWWAIVGHATGRYTPRRVYKITQAFGHRNRVTRREILEVLGE